MSLKPNGLAIISIITFLVAVAVAAAPGTVLAQPPFPTIYSGDVFVEGKLASAGLQLIPCVGGCDTGYRGNPTTVRESGSFRTLVVGPGDRKFLGLQITFHIVTEFGTVQAEETGIFREPATAGDLTKVLTLHFPALPKAPTPTPTATHTPVPSTHTPTPTSSLPIPGDPVIPRLATGVLVGGVVALVAGVVLLLWLRRRRAF